MADETKTQIPKPTRQRGPMGRMGGMRRGEKAKDFKGTMRQLLGYIGQHKIAVFAAVAEKYGIPAVATLPIDPKFAALCDEGKVEEYDVAGALDDIIAHVEAAKREEAEEKAE